MLHGVDVEMRVIEVWRCGGDEFGTCGAEELFEDGEGFGPSALHSCELFTVLFTQGSVNRVVESCGVESYADGNKGVHLVVLLRDTIVLRILLEILCAADVDEDVVEGSECVGVAVHHYVAEADVVVGCEVRGHYSREHGFFV